jgi:hypothetical protein
LEEIWINGRLVTLEVDSSKPIQPETITQQYRAQGICQDCGWYIDYCLEKEMRPRCKLTETERDSILDQHVKHYDLEQVVNGL